MVKIIGENGWTWTAVLKTVTHSSEVHGLAPDLQARSFKPVYISYSCFKAVWNQISVSWWRVSKNILFHCNKIICGLLLSYLSAHKSVNIILFFFFFNTSDIKELWQIELVVLCFDCHSPDLWATWAQLQFLVLYLNAYSTSHLTGWTSSLTSPS